MIENFKPVYLCSYYSISDDNTTLYMHKPFEMVGMCKDNIGYQSIVDTQTNDYYKNLTICPDLMNVNLVIIK
jgi:hypothetical protein